MDRAYASRYRDLYNRHWWWRAREAVILELLRRLRPTGGWKRILDVGCGGGVFFHQLSAFGPVEGIEPDAMLLSDEPDINRRIHIGPFDESYQPERSFGLILMLDVIEHLDRPADALGHALELLEPDGVIVLTVPAFLTLWTSHDDINQHRTRYTKASLSRLASATGLAIDHMEYFFHWTAAAKLGQHVLENVWPVEPKPAAVPPSPINAILHRLSRLEYRLLHSLPMPFGSSLLAYGHKRADSNARSRSASGSVQEGA